MTDSPTPRQYWGKIKDREFTKLQLSPIWVQLKIPAPDGGQIAGNARKNLEKESGNKIVTDENYLEVSEKVKRLKRK